MSQYPDDHEKQAELREEREFGRPADETDEEPKPVDEPKREGQGKHQAGSQERPA